MILPWGPCWLILEWVLERSSASECLPPRFWSRNWEDERDVSWRARGGRPTAQELSGPCSALVGLRMLGQRWGGVSRGDMCEFPVPSVLSSTPSLLGSWETSQSPHNRFMVFELGWIGFLVHATQRVLINKILTHISTNSKSSSVAINYHLDVTRHLAQFYCNHSEFWAPECY